MQEGLTVNVKEDVADEHLIEWLDENSWENLVVTDYDDTAMILWVEDCPYGIWYSDVTINQEILKTEEQNHERRD